MTTIKLTPVDKLPATLRQHVKALEAAGQREGRFGIEAAAILTDGEVVPLPGGDIDTGVTRWTGKRIDALLSTYAYRTSARKTKAVAAWISPADFLSLTTSDVASIAAEARPLDVAEMAANPQEIFLTVDDYARGQRAVTGHEGRHRAYAMLEAGVQRFPVVVYYAEGSEPPPAEQVMLDGQSFYGGRVAPGKGVVLQNVVPIAYAYAEQLRAEFGSMDAEASHAAGQPVRFSRDGEGSILGQLAGTKVVDASGAPRVVYHGTKRDFEEFDDAFINSGGADIAGIGDYGDGFYFTSDIDYANNIALDGDGEGGNVRPVLLTIKNPISARELMSIDEVQGMLADPYPGESVRRVLEVLGYDGIIVDDGLEYVVFRADQIVPAIGSGLSIRPAIEPGPVVDSEAFKVWFADSAAVGADGVPLTLYHGTGADFTSFDSARNGENSDHPTAELGFFFSTSPQVAAGFAAKETYEDDPAFAEGASIMPVHVSVKRPYIMSGEEFERHVNDSTGKQMRALRRQLEKGGHDGIRVLANPNHEGAEYELANDSWVVFNPRDVKSATGNMGTFDAESPDIRFMRIKLGGTASEAAQPAQERVLTLGKKSGPKLDAFMEEYRSLTIPHPFTRGERILPGPDPTAGGVILEASAWDGTIHLSYVRAMTERLGEGTRGLKLILDLADKHGVAVTGTAKRVGTTGLSTTELKKWYRRHGFAVKANGDMHRDPVQPQAAIGEPEPVTPPLDVTPKLESPAQPALASDRPSTASTGRAIAADADSVSAFWNWFGSSLTVDDEGRPQVLYHASHRDVEYFDRLKSKEWRKPSMDTVGIWFSDNPGTQGAGMYAQGENAAIYPVYVAIKRPKVYDTFTDFLRDMHEAEGRRFEHQHAPGLGSAEGLREKLKAQGYDGIAFTRTNTQQLLDRISALVRVIDEAKAAEWAVPKAERKALTANRKELEQQFHEVDQELRACGGSTEMDGQYVWVAFEPEQVKSAVGNPGTFDPSSPYLTDRAIGPHLAASAKALRPSETSSGNPIVADPANLEAFWSWFKDSAVAVNGKPLIVYHGTRKQFNAFSNDALGTNYDDAVTKQGFFFTEEEALARAYSWDPETRSVGRVIPAYLSIQNPIDIDGSLLGATQDDNEALARVLGAAKANGHDGAIIRDLPDGSHAKVQYVAFYPEQIKATANIGTFDPSSPDIRFQRVWHGTPHQFDRFTLDAVDSGEGTQSYGWGLYFAGKREVAEHYRDQLSEGWLESADGRRIAIESDETVFAYRALAAHGFDFDAVLAMLAAQTGRAAPGWGKTPRETGESLRSRAMGVLSEWKRAGAIHRTAGYVYAVEIPDDDVFLQWDAPMRLQKPRVIALIAARWPRGKEEFDRYVKQLDERHYGAATGRDFYHDLSMAYGGDEAASRYLASLGAAGIKYFDAMSRDEEQGTHNYVLFDDAHAQIEEPEQGITPQIESKAFRAWFGNSKVVDESGYPLVMYHGTLDDFSQFDPEATQDGAFHFGTSVAAWDAVYDNPGYEEDSDENGNPAPSIPPNLMPVYLSIHNPMRANDQDDDWGDAIAEAKDKGYDGIVYKNAHEDKGRDSWIAFRSEQIKSATGNAGTFDPANPDIRFQRAFSGANTSDLPAPVTQTEAFRDWFGNSKAVDEHGEPIKLFHGTASSFAKFKQASGWYGHGIYFTDNADWASEFAEESGLDGDNGDNVMPVYLSLQNPYIYRDRTSSEASNIALMRELGASDAQISKALSNDTGVNLISRMVKDMGHDGLIVLSPDGNEYIAYHGSQVKSATGNNGQFSPDTTDIRFQRVWHGTPHDFDRFSLDAVGTGEGATSYGWGLYFTGSRDVAEYYRNTLTLEQGFTYGGQDGLTRFQVQELVAADVGGAFLDGVIRPTGVADRVMDSLIYGGKNPYKEGSERHAVYAELRLRITRGPSIGNVYQVDIPDDGEYLLWDARFDDQPELIQHAITMLADEHGINLSSNPTGRELYNKIADGHMSSAAASKQLLAAGVVGIRYLDGLSRNNGAGTYNYVVFDDNRVEMTTAPQVETGAFKAWFDGSKIVGPDGAPLVLYHGTSESFDVFESKSPTRVYLLDGQEIERADSWDIGEDGTGKPEAYHYGALADARSMPSAEVALRMREGQLARHGGEPSPDTARMIRDLQRLVGKDLKVSVVTKATKDGFYFTPDIAYSYVRDAGDNEGGNVMPVYLSIKNPVYLDSTQIESAGKADVIEKYKAQGYDGAIFTEHPHDLQRRGWFGSTQVVAFHPHQIKSAIGNVGTFDPANPDIRFKRSESSLAAVRKAARQAFEAKLHFEEGSIAHYRSPVDGVAHFVVVPKAGGNIEILDFKVRREGMGVGSAAVREFIRAAADAGYTRVRADAVATAIAFWQKLGFHATGRKDGSLHRMMCDTRMLLQGSPHDVDVGSATNPVLAGTGGDYGFGTYVGDRAALEARYGVQPARFDGQPIDANMVNELVKTEGGIIAYGLSFVDSFGSLKSARAKLQDEAARGLAVAQKADEWLHENRARFSARSPPWDRFMHWHASLYEQPASVARSLRALADQISDKATRDRFKLAIAFPQRFAGLTGEVFYRYLEGVHGAPAASALLQRYGVDGIAHGDETEKSLDATGYVVFERDQGMFEEKNNPQNKRMSAELARRLSGTKAVDGDGNPLMVFHGSKQTIEEFDPSMTVDGGIHFGTAEQASMRVAGQGGNLTPVYLNIQKPRRCKDAGGNWRAKIAAAKHAGFDGIVYLNRYEGMTTERIEELQKADLLGKLDQMTDAQFRKAVPEARDSFIAFRATQIHPALDFAPKTPENTSQSISEPIRYQEECTAAYSGQSNMTLRAMVGDQCVGWIDYVKYRDEVSIAMVEVPERRRQGIATGLVKHLQAQYPDTEIDWGMLTDEGAKLYEALPKLVIELGDVVAKQARLAELKSKCDELMAAMDEFHALEQWTEEQRVAVVELCAPLNDLHDEIYALETELNGAKSAKTIIAFDGAPAQKLDPERVVRELMRTWEARGVECFIQCSKERINLSQLIVPKGERKRGIGSQCMQELTACADQLGLRVVLTPSVDYGASSITRLKAFYRRFGFVENKGRNKDFSLSEGMYRDPVEPQAEDALFLRSPAPIPVEARLSPELEAVRTLAGVFGTKVTMFRQTEDSAFKFGGVMLDKTIWLNEEAEKPLHVVFGHEIVHLMRSERPELYAALHAAVTPLLVGEARYSRMVGLAGHDRAYVQEEMIADLMGDRFAEPKFWQQVAAKNPSMFGGLVKYVTGIIDKVKAALAGVPAKTLMSDQFVSDLDRARSALADTLAQYAQIKQSSAAGRGFFESIKGSGSLGALRKPPIDVKAVVQLVAEDIDDTVKGLYQSATGCAPEYDAVLEWVTCDAFAYGRPAAVQEQLIAVAVARGYQLPRQPSTATLSSHAERAPGIDAATKPRHRAEPEKGATVGHVEPS